MDVLNIIILCLIFICNILGTVAFIMHFTNKKNNILGTSNMKSTNGVQIKDNKASAYHAYKSWKKANNGKTVVDYLDSSDFNKKYRIKINKILNITGSPEFKPKYYWNIIMCVNYKLYSNPSKWMKFLYDIDLEKIYSSIKDFKPSTPMNPQTPQNYFKAWDKLFLRFNRFDRNFKCTVNLSEVKFPKKKIDEMIKILTDSKKYMKSYWVWVSTPYINILKCVKKKFKDNKILKDIYEDLIDFEDLVQKAKTKTNPNDLLWKQVFDYFEPWHDIYNKFKSLDESFNCGENLPR